MLLNVMRLSKHGQHMYKLKRKIVNVRQQIYFNSFILIKHKHAKKKIIGILLLRKKWVIQR